MITGHAWDEGRAHLIIEELKELPGALLPILHALQEEFGYIHPDAVPLVAQALFLSHAEVVGVISFYHDFRREPAGCHTLRVCRAEACQSMGCETVVDHLRSRLGIEMGQTTADGAITLQTVYCLGNCALSPAVMLDGSLYGRVSLERVDELIDAARSRA
jgi:formate dehydrogenase subunit gamma